MNSASVYGDGERERDMTRLEPHKAQGEKTSRRIRRAASDISFYYVTYLCRDFSGIANRFSDMKIKVSIGDRTLHRVGTTEIERDKRLFLQNRFDKTEARSKMVENEKEMERNR